MNSSYGNPIPNRGIFIKKNEDYSFAHSSLQALSCLDCIFNIANNFQIIQLFPNNTLVKEFLSLLYCLYNKTNQSPTSDAIINNFERLYYNNRNQIKTQKVLNHDPFHFLYFLLQFMHIEINNPIEPYYDLSNLYPNIQIQQNDNSMFQIFCDFFQKTQNSFISDNFYNIEKHTFNCQSCGIYYFYNMKNIIKIEVDKAKFYRNSSFPQKSGYITLYELFDYYFSPNREICKNCSKVGDEDVKLSIHNNVIIIHLNRNSHNNNFNNDINFEININMEKYIRNSIGNYEYSLKSLIAFNGMKYISICFINNNFYKYIDTEGSQVQYLDGVYQYEPQILIYEKKTNQNFNNQFCNNGFNNQNYNNNNNNNNNKPNSNSSDALFNRIKNSSFINCEGNNHNGNLSFEQKLDFQMNKVNNLNEIFSYFNKILGKNNENLKI